MSDHEGPATGSSPYSTGGGGVRLEHAYAACLVAGLLAGDALPELGDAITVHTIRLQASDLSDADDILLEGQDAQGELYRASIAVRRNPALNMSDDSSVPLIRDFIAVMTDHWSEVSSGRWRLVLAVSTNSNAVTELAELATLASSLPSGDELANRLAQDGRTNARVRGRYDHVRGLTQKASKGIDFADGLTPDELTWRLLSSLHVRSLRLERTNGEDRTSAIKSLRQALPNSTPAVADALYSRLEELVGEWASQAAILTQSLVRKRLREFPLVGSGAFMPAWHVLHRLGVRLRDAVRPSLLSGDISVELDRPVEKDQLANAMQSVGASIGTLVVTGDPDVGKSALALRAAEALEADGAAIIRLSLRDIPASVSALEAELGNHGLDDVFGAAVVGQIRLILVDGAEAVLEGKSTVFRAITSAGIRAGFGVVGVTRTDGARQVEDDLKRALEATGKSLAPTLHNVMPLSVEERQQLPEAFAALKRLSLDPRTNYVLGRPGLVDALLRAGVAVEPGDVLGEADVYSAVWRGLVRRDEVHAPGYASPDDRDGAALGVARRALGLPAGQIAGTGAAELRSDGVLRVPNNTAFAVGDEFATDLFRDFALCRLFITEGWGALSSAGAPRWAIRAARLGCQAALLGPSRLQSWAQLTTSFDNIAAREGGRWAELPYEALLALGHAEPAIRELWNSLKADESAGLKTLFRIAESRYVSGTIGDVFALAPLVAVAFCDQPLIATSPRAGRQTLHHTTRELVLAWLRGMATEGVQPDGLRQKVREVVLDAYPATYDDFAIEAIALLGPDLNDRADEWLRRVGDERADALNVAVESVAVAVSMSRARPKLLLDLAEIYYIELPEPDEDWAYDSFNEGIRDSRHGFGSGFGTPAAAWYYGPFFQLLNTIPREAMGFINRMLNHAAKARVSRTAQIRGHIEQDQQATGLELELAGIGVRRYIGDSHVWAWYRASSVGPYPCMSALLALEKFTDRMLEVWKLPAKNIVKFLLQESHNLAVPGMLFGFLVRHPADTNDLLDAFLEHPEVWHLETSRVVGEHFHVRDSSADKLTGNARRVLTPHQTVGAMVVHARLNGDEIRLTELERVGIRLVENAKRDGSGGEVDGEYVAMVGTWAAEFQSENYQAAQSPEGLIIEFKRPAPVHAVLEKKTMR